MEAIYFIAALICSSPNVCAAEVPFEEHVYESRRDCDEARRELERQIKNGKNVKLVCRSELRRKDR